MVGIGCLSVLGLCWQGIAFTDGCMMKKMRLIVVFMIGVVVGCGGMYVGMGMLLQPRMYRVFGPEFVEVRRSAGMRLDVIARDIAWDMAAKVETQDGSYEIPSFEFRKWRYGTIKGVDGSSAFVSYCRFVGDDEIVYELDGITLGKDRPTLVRLRTSEHHRLIFLHKKLLDKIKAGQGR